MGGDAMARVTALEERWREALLIKDEAALRALIHPAYELVGIRATGCISVNLEAWMHALQGMDLAALDLKVIDAVAMPHTIVATLEADWQVRYRGHCIEERVLLTDVWVCEDDMGKQWQVLRRHSSLIPAGVKIG